MTQLRSLIDLRLDGFVSADEALREPRVREGYAAALGALVAAIQGYVVLSSAGPSIVPRGSAAASVRAMTRGLLDAEVPS